MTIAQDMLPTVAEYQVSTSHNRRYSDSSMGGMLFVNRTDSAVQPSSYRVTWSNRSPSHVAAIVQHYESYAAGTFKWIGPGQTVQSTWRWRTAPYVTWTSARNASVTADVEPALAFTT